MGDKVKSDNVKAIPKFLLIIAVSGALGGLMGFFGNILFASIDGFGSVIATLIMTKAPVLIIGWTVMTLMIGLGLYFLGKKYYLEIDPSEDEYPEKGDRLIGCSLIMSSVGTIGTFFLFTAAVLSPYSVVWYDAMTVLCFLAAMFLYIMLQKLCVDFLRKTNPEKRGSVFDTKFQEKWVESCDEAEQLIIYKSAFAAFKTTSYTCITMWLVLIFMGMFAQVDVLLPVGLVLMIWCVQTITYGVQSMRLEKGGRKNAADKKA